MVLMVFILMKQGTKNKINVTTKEDYFVTINKKDIRHLNVALNYNGPIKAPIQKEEKIAELIIKQKNDVLKILFYQMGRTLI